MKIVVADTGALISLSLIGQIDLIEKIFGNFFIANAVWEELLRYENLNIDNDLKAQFEKHVLHIKSQNYLAIMMDYGESESIILYKEINADYFLIDDNKARFIAESMSINCVGSIGLLIKAKEKGIINNLKPLFERWFEQGRYFSINLLNQILVKYGEEPIVK